MTFKEWLDYNERLLCGDWIHLHITDHKGEQSNIIGAFRTRHARVLYGNYLVVAMTGEIIQGDTHLVSLALVTPGKEDGDPGDG